MAIRLQMTGDRLSGSGLIPGFTYRLIDQTLMTPIDPGLHSMTVKVMSCGASGVHFREIAAFGYVDEHGQLAHIELPNGDVLHWWSWDRDREKKRRACRDIYGESVPQEAAPTADASTLKNLSAPRTFV